jgi:hypothetical protein
LMEDSFRTIFTAVKLFSPFFPPCQAGRWRHPAERHGSHKLSGQDVVSCQTRSFATFTGTRNRELIPNNKTASFLELHTARPQIYDDGRHSQGWHSQLTPCKGLLLLLLWMSTHYYWKAFFTHVWRF